MKTKLLFQQIKQKSIPHEMAPLKTVNLSSLSLDKIALLHPHSYPQ